MKILTRALIFFALCLPASLCYGKMQFKVTSDGTMSMRCDGKEYISRSSIGLVLKDGALHAPVSAKTSKGQIRLGFDCCEVLLDAKYRDNGSLRLSVASIPDEIDGFVFGPFVCPDCTEAGEIVGAAWHGDGSLVCIQSLNPKTEGECDLEFTNDTPFRSPADQVAVLEDGTVYLSCSAGNMTRPHLIKQCRWSGFKDIWTEAVPAPEGSIEGAAIVLTCAPDATTMLEDISRIETEEGLPHPTINGDWAKTSKRAADLYFVFGDSGIEKQVEMAERAGVHWVYFNDPFESWGHFGISRNQYPGGFDEFKGVIDYARGHGVNIGFHTLSNFIHPYDPFVTPVPHKDMLAFDPAPILKDLSETDTEIFIGKEMNYAIKGNLSTVRLGDELIQFDRYDAERKCLTGCTRGAFGTKAASYKAGTVLTHMADHGYGTFFPSYKLQSEMADNVASLIRDAGIKRMSFDGMEGCLWTGLGEFACSDYVRRAFQTFGDELICDASTPSHYRWHAHTYFNWGEPYWDSHFRGGMYNYRSTNQDKFTRNLMPRMLGWYHIQESQKHFEPTLPETLEFILSRSVAYDAGMCIFIYSHKPESQAKLDKYLDKIRDWQDFRFSVDVPDELRARMREEKTDWHLEKKDGKWILSDMFIDTEDLAFHDYAKPLPDGSVYHESVCMVDRNTSGKDVPLLVEPQHFRIRVGNCYNHGILEGLRITGRFTAVGTDLEFKVKANAGDYLEYDGGLTLNHYDKDYNLLETLEGKGKEIIVENAGYSGLRFHYTVKGLKEDEFMPITFKSIRATRHYEFDIK